jgi:hypothetical protein
MLLGVMALGTVGFMVAEDLSLEDAFYFSIVTITTVGYGDIHPASAAGKWLTIILIVTGVGTFLGVVASATEMMLNKREKEIRLQKLQMVIGAFFSEVGTKLLELFSEFDPDLDKIREHLTVKAAWKEEDFLRVHRVLENHEYGVDGQKIDLGGLRSFLLKKRDFLLRLLENPTLLEHESFTELLRAVFHLTEELAYRTDVVQLVDTDRTHLVGDTKRAYGLLVGQWLGYMEYLKVHYPYLYSLAVRTNPFNRESSPVVT